MPIALVEELKQTSTPRCFVKGGMENKISAATGIFIPQRLLLKLHTALHAKKGQREIKENLRYHESAVLNVQDGRYSHRIGKEVYHLFRYPVEHIVIQTKR